MTYITVIFENALQPRHAADAQGRGRCREDDSPAVGQDAGCRDSWRYPGEHYISLVQSQDSLVSYFLKYCVTNSKSCTLSI